jgi:hypothetical protein
MVPGLTSMGRERFEEDAWHQKIHDLTSTLAEINKLAYGLTSWPESLAVPPGA